MTHTRKLIPSILILVVVASSSCHRSSTPAPAAAGTKRYAFTGRVQSIDLSEQSALIDGDDVPGFMMPMAMTYKVKPPDALKQLATGDSISAEVVVVEPKNKDDAPSDYWLENVKVTAHGKAQPSSPPLTQRIPAPGDDVPDFAFTNQSGRRVSLHQYRGRVLLVTFIYTRCPFPDFCPRMSSNFAEIDQQFAHDSTTAGRAHLLSVSFDPEHDTPRVLRDYAYSVAHTHDAAQFRRWEFVVPSAADLPGIADFFGLVAKPEGGVITHNLSTTVIGPDGKIIRWYHGGDWQASDLIKDTTEALNPKT